VCVCVCVYGNEQGGITSSVRRHAVTQPRLTKEKNRNDKQTSTSPTREL
jgi:hypothetical protein